MDENLKGKFFTELGKSICECVSLGEVTIWIAFLKPLDYRIGFTFDIGMI